MSYTVASAHDLGRAIRDRRSSLELTQAELAAFAGVSLRVLSSLESGKPTVRLDVLLPLIDALGLEITLAPRITP